MRDLCGQHSWLGVSRVTILRPISKGTANLKDETRVAGPLRYRLWQQGLLILGAAGGSASQALCRQFLPKTR